MQWVWPLKKKKKEEEEERMFVDRGEGALGFGGLGNLRNRPASVLLLARQASAWHSQVKDVSLQLL